MKKLAILACGVLAACALMLTACGDEPNVETPTTVPTTKGHTHAFGEWVTVKEATCTEKGEQERVCACGEKITQSVNMVAHTFNEWYTTKEATCTETGKQECNCACGKKKTRNVPMIAHTEVIDEAVAHSCTETGLTEGKHCSVCNMVLQKQEIVAASHTWSIEYQSDQNVHWTYCDKCGTVSEQMLHTINRADYCSVCKMQNAKGLICVIPEKSMYARVVGYTGSATCVKIPE